VEFLSVRTGRLAMAFQSRIVASVMCVLALAGTRAFAQSSTIEYPVKATYLYKFAPFVEWPPGTFAAPSDPLVLCIAGVDPVGELVDEAAKGQTVGGRAILVVHQWTPAREARCHILYVASRGLPAQAALDSVRGTPVLTVTDSAHDPRAQGIINFVVQDNRVRFEIDPNAAADNHLVISSKLLNLAVRVRPKP
jgi:hypothetical protein